MSTEPPVFGVAMLLVVQTWVATPFLDQFARRQTTPPVERSVQVPIGGRQAAGYLVTPAAAERLLPAVLLVSGREGLTDSLRQSARELGGIGYVALAVDYRGDESGGSALLKEISGSSGQLVDAVNWLAAQPSVDPERIGAIGWNDAFDALTRLAQTGTVKAYPARLASQSGMPEDAWVAIYEWMGKNVEEAPVMTFLPQPGLQFARIVDIMRAINSDQGVRGRLARALAAPPANDASWEQARGEAAMVAEGGNLLLAEQPPKGSLAGWRRRAADFRDAAETLLRAVERRDFAAAQTSLRELPQTCSACHAEYR